VVTDVGNPPTRTTRVELNFSGYDEQTPGGLTLASGLKITDAWVVLDSVATPRLPDCGEADTAAVDGPIVIDLLASQTTPSPVEFTTRSGQYCGLTLQLAALKSDADGPASLSGHSVWVRGSIDRGDDFEILADFDDPIALRGPGGEAVTLTGDQLALLVGFAMNRWLDANAVHDADDSDGLVRIGPQSNAQLYERFHQRFLQSVSLFRDGNANGQIDEGEREEPVGDSGSATPADTLDAGLDAAADGGERSSEETDAGTDAGTGEREDGGNGGSGDSG